MFNYLGQFARYCLFSSVYTLKTRNSLFYLCSLLLISLTMGRNPSSSVPIKTSALTVDTVEMVQQGIEKSRRGNYQGALKDFNQVIAENPQDIHAYFNRGYAHSSLGQFEQALADFTIALKLDPQMVEAYVNRGNVYLQLGEDETAIADYEKALEINPFDQPSVELIKVETKKILT